VERDIDFLDLGHLAFEDQVLDERRVEHDFHGCNPAGAGLAGNQPLGDQGARVERQIHQQLLAPLVGKEVDDAVERLVGAVRVQGRQHEMAGLGELDGVFHGLAVTDFADQDDIGACRSVFLESGMPRVCIHSTSRCVMTQPLC